MEDAQPNTQDTQNTRFRYLPTTVKGKTVLIHEGGLLFRVDNSKLNAPTAGVVFRKSKDMDDIDPAWEALAPWGGIIEGTDEGDGWVKMVVGAEHGADFNDPFLSHVPDSAKAPAAEKSFMQKLKQWPAMISDPFLSHAGLKQQSSLKNDIPYTGDPGRLPRRITVPGSACRALVLGSWFSFVVMLVVWSCLQHAAYSASVLLSAILVSFCIAILILSRRGVRKIKNVPLMHLGVLCLLAAVLGIIMGQEGWFNRWRPYWWLRTGRHTIASAATPAAAVRDAAILNFTVPSHELMSNKSLVDHSKSAGFRDGHVYCVAPILNADLAAASYALVNYWAVGIDCCENVGSFTCDASRDYQGGFGIVMLDAGFPCPGCHKEEFAAAIKKAEYEHGLVSADGALYVRWVQDGAAFTKWEYVNAVVVLVVVAVVFFFVFLILGVSAARHASEEAALPLLKQLASPSRSVESDRADRHRETDLPAPVLGVDVTPLATDEQPVATPAPRRHRSPRSAQGAEQDV